MQYISVRPAHPRARVSSRWLLALIAGAWLAIATVAPAHAIAFTPHADFAVGHHPLFIAAGDVNGDGKADLITANVHAANLSVLLGDGAGGFGAKTDYDAGWNPAVVAITDLNGDAIPDLVSANIADSTWSLKTVSVLLGLGGGAFGPYTQVLTGSAGIESMAVGDLNLDGHPDLAVVANDMNGAVLLGDGAGGFGAPIGFQNGPRGHEVTIGDLNGDSVPDLVVAYGSSIDQYYVAVSLGDGTGSFGTWTSVVSPPTLAPVAIGDLNGDGQADIAMAVSGGGAAALLGDGSGGFIPPWRTFPLSANSSQSSIAVGDLNGDSMMDMATVNPNLNDVSVFWGDGTGNFVEGVQPATGTFPASVALADFDGDGKLDIATANESADTVSVILQLPPDTDGDGCGDSREVLLTPPTNPADPWDFYSVPVPALYAAPNPLIAFSDNVVSAADGEAVFGYFKLGAKSGTPEYEQDLNGNGVRDGLEYDRSVAGPGQSGPPDGAVTAADAQLAFAQFKRGYKC